MTKTRLLVAAGVLVVAAAVLAVLAYPAWSAAGGDDARWVVEATGAEVLDYDDDRLLVLDDETLRVLDRETGAESPAGSVDWQKRAALVPGGVVASANGRLELTGPDGRVVWEKQQEAVGDPVHTLAAVDVEAGVAVAAVGPEQNDGPQILTAFALADGAPVWTMPDVARVGLLRGGEEPAGPPWRLHAGLVPVIRVGGYPPGTAPEPATWSLVSAASGEVTTEIVESGSDGMPVAVGDVALRSRVSNCADLAIIAGPEVRWLDDPPVGECRLVWTLDPERALFTSWEDQNATSGGDDGVLLYSLSLETGEVTKLDWSGGFLDTVAESEAREMTQSWGHYLRSRDAVYDTRTGEEKWRGAEVWLGGDSAVVAEPVTGLDRLASGASDPARWLRLADAATGEATEGGYIADRVIAVDVLDHGQAVVFTPDQVALLG